MTVNISKATSSYKFSQHPLLPLNAHNQYKHHSYTVSCNHDCIFAITACITVSNSAGPALCACLPDKGPLVKVVLFKLNERLVFKTFSVKPDHL